MGSWGGAIQSFTAAVQTVNVVRFCHIFFFMFPAILSSAIHFKVVSRCCLIPIFTPLTSNFIAILTLILSKWMTIDAESPSLLATAINTTPLTVTAATCRHHENKNQRQSREKMYCNLLLNNLCHVG